MMKLLIVVGALLVIKLMREIDAYSEDIGQVQYADKGLEDIERKN